MNISLIQQELDSQNIDAWLLYDFRGTNTIAWKICDVPPATHCTRRWAVIVPRVGDPIKIVSSIEAHTMAHLDMKELKYSNAVEWHDAIERCLHDYKTIAMEYSHLCALPVVSKVDAGTVEWVRSLGHDVVSSADVAQRFQAVWTEDQLMDNLVTSGIVRSAMMDAMSFIKEKITLKHRVSEFDVQQNIMRYFSENQVQTDNEPIVAIAKNASSPHYSPTPEKNDLIGPDQLVLIDMWAKGTRPWSTYADITWMCHTGSEASARAHTVFNTVRDARDSALDLVRQRFQASQILRGFEVDDAARAVISAAGFGEYFIHRTGHNIGEETHGAGANMDNFETHDTRRIMCGTSFSIEPGIYISNEIGVRLEISVIIDLEGNVVVPSEPIQEKIVFLGA